MTVFVAILLAYLVGAVSGALLIGRLLGKADIRNSGSGNAGATNALRGGGRGYALAVLAFDLAKGWFAALAIPALLGGPAWLGYACGAAGVAGHVYPLYYGCRGGKGAATLIGVLLALTPWHLFAGIAVWGATLMLTGFVGLATVLGMAAVAVALVVSHWPALLAVPVVFGLSMSIFIAYTHRDNLRRMRCGRESRFERMMLLRRWR